MIARQGITRRRAARVALAGAAGLALPWAARRATAAEPIKIGMPMALTGPLGSVGQQLKRGGEAWAKAQNAKGGLLGRQIELLIEDTAGDPADLRAQGAGNGGARRLPHLSPASRFRPRRWRWCRNSPSGTRSSSRPTMATAD